MQTPQAARLARRRVRIIRERLIELVDRYLARRDPGYAAPAA